MLNRMGINVSQADIKGKTKNIAAVIVTAKLPTMVRPAQRLMFKYRPSEMQKACRVDSAHGPMKGPDGNVYAVAQGPISIGVFRLAEVGRRQ